MEWLNLIIPALVTLIVSGGIYIGLNKQLKHVEVKLKDQEVKDKEADVLRKQDDEWQELYREARARADRMEEENKQLRLEKEELARENGKLELRIQQLRWFKCEVNNCPNRKPPHVFDLDGNEFEAQINHD